MGFVNDVHSLPLGETAQGHVEGLVRVRGYSGSAAGRSFGFHRYEPEAVVIRGQDELRRLPIEASVNNVSLVALPVAAYIAARLLLRRRRR